MPFFYVKNPSRKLLVSHKVKFSYVHKVKFSCVHPGFRMDTSLIIYEGDEISFRSVVIMAAEGYDVLSLPFG